MKALDQLYVAATNDDTIDAVQLSVGSYFSSCQYFDTSMESWSRSGCQPQEESTASVTSCVCNHLTAFGGNSFVSITDISFEDLDVGAPYHVNWRTYLFFILFCLLNFLPLLRVTSWPFVLDLMVLRFRS